jgi:hypothetical protein
VNRPAATLGLALGMLLCSARAPAQDAESLYRAGAFGAAADSFAARAAAEPDVPAHHYNLGTALYRLGDETGARAAWVRAARALPRHADLRRAVNLVAPPDATSAAATSVAVVTPGEVLAGALLLWIVGWGLVAFRRPFRHAAVVLLAAVVVGALGVGKAREYRRPVALVRHPNTALRAAPFASANARRAMNAGTSVEVVRRYAGWVLVRRGNDRGWLQATDIVPLT